MEAEYYEVDLANDGQEAVDKARANPPDLILLDVMMPRMNGLEACRVMKADPRLRHVPVVMVTALDQREDRVAGLEAGADDFLTKPVDEVALFARVRSQLRLKSVMDELRQRQASGRALGAIETSEEAERVESDAKILVVDDPGRPGERLTRRLQAEHRPRLETDPRTAAHAALGAWDLIIINLAADTFDGLRLVARLLSDESTRSIPILAIVDASDREKMVRALEMGVNDLLTRPVDRGEMSARVRTLVRRKRFADFLRATLDNSLELAVTDQLTGLHNRRFMTSQLRELGEAAAARDELLAVVIADIDHFKRVNDTHGHDAGDRVLKEFARRLAANVRAVDIACRYGGEEFVVIMPGASLDEAKSVAERVRAAVRAEPFKLGAAADSATLDVTVSAGVAAFDAAEDLDTLIKRADGALYDAKTGGRDRVEIASDGKKAA